jgi:hydrogenase 3 maturation protease
LIRAGGGIADLADEAAQAGERTVVVGVGNELRGDDAAGPLIARKLAVALGGDPCQGRLASLDCGEVPENYLGPILETSPTRVIFCDAVDFGGVAGEVRVFGLHELSAPSVSTHNASLSVLAKVLAASGVRDQLLIGVQPAHLAFGGVCSGEVARAVESVVQQLLSCVASSQEEDETPQAED